MRTPTKFRHLPIRLAAGSYILDAGIGKLDADDEKAKHLHSFAAGTYPILNQIDAPTFAKVLAVTEITIGSALVLPLVPSRIAGLALGAFAAGLLGLYMKTPGMRRAGSVMPSQDGTALAKDVWLLGIAGALVMDRASSRPKKGRA